MYPKSLMLPQNQAQKHQHEMKEGYIRYPATLVKKVEKEF